MLTMLHAGPTIPILLALALAFTHWVGDFKFQSNWMALNKGKNTVEGAKALIQHCFVYACCFAWVSIEFAWITFALHLLTDAVTSRVNSKLWFVKAELVSDGPYAVPALVFDDSKRHWFFVSIGFDQYVHTACLLGTYWWLS